MEAKLERISVFQIKRISEQMVEARGVELRMGVE
jgi:hypothetical protein